MAVLHEQLQDATELMKNVEHNVALSGAGISTKSGIPGFTAQVPSARNSHLSVISIPSASKTHANKTGKHDIISQPRYCPLNRNPVWSAHTIWGAITGEEITLVCDFFGCWLLVKSKPSSHFATFCAVLAERGFPIERLHWYGLALHLRTVAGVEETLPNDPYLSPKLTY